MARHIYVVAILFALISCSKEDPIEAPTIKPVLDPGAVSLKLPENNKDCETGVVTADKAEIEFSWAATENAQKYQLVVNSAVNGKVIDLTDLSVTTQKVNLTRGQAYTWNITAFNSLGKSSISPSWKFYLSSDGITNRSPTPAKIIYPLPGSTVNLNESGKIKLEWYSEDIDKDPLLYEVRIDTIDGKQKSISSLIDLKVPQAEIGLKSGKVYYWSVVTKDPAISVVSDIFSFKIR
jgi:hypothetical protein